MNTSEHILHDRVNLVRLVRRLDKSINEVNWGSEPNPTLWFRSEGLLQQLKHARRLLSNVEFHNDLHPSAKLRRRLTDIRCLLDKLDSFMLSVNERVVPEPPCAEPILPTLSFPRPSTRTADLPVVNRLAPPSDVTSGLLEEIRPTAVDVDLLLGSAERDEPSLPREPSLDAGAVPTSSLSPKIQPSPLVSTTDAAPSQALLQHSTAVQEELSAQLAQMAGQLRRNAEHFSKALAADQAVLRDAEEKVGTNYDVMKRERVRLRDHRGRSIGTTCLTITSILVVTVAFVVMLFILRFT